MATRDGVSLTNVPWLQGDGVHATARCIFDTTNGGWWRRVDSGVYRVEKGSQFAQNASWRGFEARFGP